MEEIPGFFLNCAYWPGVMLSAAGGRWTADLISGKMDPAENPLRFKRFEEGTTAAPSLITDEIWHTGNVAVY